MSRRARNAFTLMELLLVMVILVVLASIVVPKFIGRSKDAQIKAATADISHISTALETFESDYGRFPTTDEGLAALINPPARKDGTAGIPMLEKMPVDPWGNPYVYTSPGVHNPRSYDLLSWGPDLHEGGGDDISNFSDQSK